MAQHAFDPNALEEARRKQQLAELLFSRGQNARDPINALLGSFMGRRRMKSSGEDVSRLEEQSKQQDLAALAAALAGDPSQVATIRDPEIQKIAQAMVGQQATRKQFEDKETGLNTRAAATIAEQRAARGAKPPVETPDQKSARRVADELAIERGKRELSGADADDARKRAEPTFIEKQTIGASRKRLDSLSESKATRNTALGKAQDFLAAFESGTAQGILEGLDLGTGVESGAGRALANSSLIFTDIKAPTFSDQGRFDELLDAFAEEAARAKLKAAGEIRPTDADVVGMKKSIFGIGKDETVNISLLKSFIEEQQSNDSELVELNRQFGREEEGGAEAQIIGTHPVHGDITEEDILETMRANNMTREQVMEALSAG